MTYMTEDLQLDAYCSLSSEPDAHFLFLSSEKGASQQSSTFESWSRAVISVPLWRALLATP